RVLHRELASRLERDTGVRVSLLRGEAERFLPANVDLLLDLERLLYRLPGPRLADRIAPDRSVLDQPHRDDRSDLIIDLSGMSTEHAERVICLRYDGLPGWEPLIGALLAGRMPILELLDGQDGAVLARGEPCADNASTLSDALECVLARIVT